MSPNPLRSLLFVVAVASLVALAPSGAEAGTVSRSNDDSGAVAGVTRAFGVPTYWTPERMRNAQPYTPPVDAAAAAAADEEFDTEASDEESESGSAGRPTRDVRPDPIKLFVPRPAPAAADAFDDDSIATPAARGTAGYNFSSSRIISTSAERAFPYRTIGKLFFNKPGQGDFVCSGAVLRPRVVVTAGHCVHSGRNGSNGFYRNFMFVPAYRNGNAPFGTWDWEWVTTTSAWSTGGGAVPNVADYAMFEMRDRRVNGRNRKIADLTGHLGWKTNAAHPNHTHAIGYPVNLDNGQKMHQVAAQSQGNFGTNTARYGSDMRGGSSGGPFVQNFGKKASGQNKGKNKGTNQIVGIVSSVPVNQDILYSSTSRLDSRFSSLLTRACNHRSGNC